MPQASRHVLSHLLKQTGTNLQSLAQQAFNHGKALTLAITGLT